MTGGAAVTVAVVATLPAGATRPEVVAVPSCRSALARARAVQSDSDGSLRVGVAVGDATPTGDEWTGAPVRLAAALAVAAAPGEVLVSEVVVLVAGDRAARFGPGRAIDVDGHSVTVRPLEWAEVTVAPALRFPPPLAASGFPFVGRHAERSALHQAATSVAGRTRVVLVAGEPGIGKTRTVSEVAAALHAAGHVVLAGRCDEGLRVPYQPFLGALRDVVSALPADELVRRLGRYPSELARLVPELTDIVPALPPPLRSDPETEQYRFFEAITSWLAAMAETAPVLLVLDDVHWAARPTLLLLRHIATTQRAPGVCVVATYRDTELLERHPLTDVLADLRTIPGVVRIALGGLNAQDTALFLEAAGRPDLPASVGTRTAGNPFFLGELVRDLAESGVDSVPASVRDVVASRLARLPDTALDALVASAVTGQEFDAETVGAVMGIEAEEVAVALDDAITARLVVEVDGRRPMYRFAHAIVQETLYDQLSEARKGRLHRRAAEALEATGEAAARAAELAHHWARAWGPDATPNAVTWSVTAGWRALRLLAHDEAVDWFAAALALSDAGEGHQRCDLLTALGEAQRRAGNAAYRDTLLAAARIAEALGDADRLVAAALANSRGTYASVGEVDHERVEVLHTALAALGEQDRPERARLLAQIGMELTFSGDWPSIVEFSDRAVAAARAGDDDATVAHCLLLRHESVWHAETLGDRLAMAAELESFARHLGDPQLECFASLWGADDALEAEQFPLAEARVANAWRLADELAQPGLRWLATMRQATWAMVNGRLEDAERHILDQWRLGRMSGQPDAALLYATQEFQIARLRGRLGQIDPAPIAANVAARPAIAGLRVGLALVHCARGELDDAATALAPLVADRFVAIPHDRLWVGTVADAAEVVAATGDAAAAVELSALLAPYADQSATMGGPTWQGPVTRYLGLLAVTAGRIDDGCDLLEAAVQRCERLGAGPQLTFAEIDWATALARRAGPGDREHAEAIAAQAGGRARAIGMAGAARAAAAVAAS